MFMSGDEIYRNFAEALGPASLAGGAEAVRRLADDAQQLADDIMRLAGSMETAWQGDAADLAHHGAARLSTAHAVAVPLIHIAQDLTSRQVGSFVTAKNTVRPVPPEPAKPDPWLMIFTDSAATFADQVAAHRNAAEHNVEVMRAYENASAYNTSGQPQSYGTITFDGGVVVLESAEGTVTPPPTIRTPGTDQPVVHKADVKPVQPKPGGGEQPVPTVVPPPPAVHHTDPGHHVPPATPLPGTVQPSLAVDSPHRTNSATSGEGGGARPGSPADNHMIGGRVEGVRRVGGYAEGGGAVHGFAAAASDRTAPARTKGGLPQGVAAPAKGKGGEDEEHRRASFLQEVDPESVFGTNEKTTPPVID